MPDIISAIRWSVRSSESNAILLLGAGVGCPNPLKAFELIVLFFISGEDIDNECVQYQLETARKAMSIIAAGVKSFFSRIQCATKTCVIRITVTLNVIAI